MSEACKQAAKAFLTASAKHDPQPIADLLHQDATYWTASLVGLA
ncbi:MAG: hypothetical protein QM676_02835 [Novosphingobium sp.]